MKIPLDNETAREKHNDMCCGLACLSVIEEINIEKVLKNWKEMGMKFEGYCRYTHLKDYLKIKDYDVKQIRWNKLEIVNPNSFYILRVQWLGNNLEKIEKPFYGWSFWNEASANTHFIVLHKSKVFCNSEGIFDYDKLSDYLGDDGLITSALEISSQNTSSTHEVKK